ncbi:MAG: 3-phosphoserine/phosphohydroxythreonine transaminase, partial [Actinomycetota bacterium]
NFCAGPCTLPMSVITELADELPDFGGTGMSLIEMSHRDPVYDEVHHGTIDALRRLCAVPDDFSILLLQGGATLQFAMVPMNLLGSGQVGAYSVTGSWAKKAIADAAKIGQTAVAWDGGDDGYRAMPTADDLDVPDGVRYLHTTSNETIGGIRLPEFYDLPVRQVADMSSDYLTRAIPWDRFDLVYGGAQKNLGPAGLAVVFVRNSVLEEIPESVPSYLSFATHAKADSLANTPPVFSVWATGKVLSWIEANGGVPAMEKRAAERSAMVYDAIDGSGGFYRSPVAAVDRSHTNVVFRLPSEELESAFLAEATTANLVNLKGHRSVGGIRASIYNALPTESVSALVDHMAAFAASNG